MLTHWERFYSAYPKKEGRGAAIKAWNKHTAKMTPEELEAFTLKAIAAIAEQKRSRWDSIERKYIPQPSTWLNQCRWDDEIPSFTEKKEAKESELCACGQPAFNRKVCARCYTKMVDPLFKERMTHHLRDMGFNKKPGESWRDASLRCLTENGYAHMIPKDAG